MGINRTDIEFISEFCPSIADNYEEAKRLYQDVPIYTLVELRSICAKITDGELKLYGIQSGLKMDLFLKINGLRSIDGYPNDVVGVLHEIRIKCNKGAHREDDMLTKEMYVGLAKEALQQTCKLIYLLYRYHNRRSNYLEYDFVECETPLIKDLLYEAIIQKDVKSQVRVGKILTSRRFDEAACLSNSYYEKSSDFNYDDLQTKLAYQLLSSAVNQDDVEGMYTLGRLLCLGVLSPFADSNDDDLPDWKLLVHTAAESGHIEAKEFFAIKILMNRQGDLQSVDEKYAQKAISYADELSHDSAPCQELLGRLHMEGFLLEKNLTKSRHYYRKAADNGRRVSQYNFALLSKDISETETYKKYVSASASNGYKPAIREMLRDSGRSYTERVEVFDSYKWLERPEYGERIYFELDTDIKFEYSMLVCDEMKESERVLTAFILLGNYLSACENSIGVLDLQHVLTKMVNAYNYIQENGRVELSDLGTLMMTTGMLKYRIAKLEDRKQEKLLQEQRRAQVETQHLLEKIMPLKALNQKIGRNEICPYCDSGNKYKKCCAKRYH